MIAGKYRVVRKLGSGGMAEVFLARAEGPGGFSRAVVLKRLDAAIARDPDAVTLFLDEARTASRLHHQHIAQVFDFGHDADGYYLAMEYLDGADARALVRAAPTGIAIEAAVAIASAAALGLHHAHALADDHGKLLDVVHRDVTAGNVFVTFDGAVKVIDFGIARAADRTTRTREGLVRGTVVYMSPEQVQGFVLDRRSDLFSLGVVLYELVTGRRPHDHPGDSDLVVMRRVEAGVHASPSSLRRDLPPALEDVIERLLEVDPALRFPTGEAVATALDAIKRMPVPELGRYVRSIVPSLAPGAAGDPEPVPTPVAEPTGRTLPGPPVRLAPPKAAQTRSRRLPLAAAIGGVVAVVGIVGGVAATRDRAPAPAAASDASGDPAPVIGVTIDAAVSPKAASCMRYALIGIESAKGMIDDKRQSAWSIRSTLVNVAAQLGLDEQPWAEGIRADCAGITSLAGYADTRRLYDDVEADLDGYEHDKELVFTGTNRFGQLGYQDLRSDKILGEDEAKSR